MAQLTWQELLNSLSSSALIDTSLDDTSLKECSKNVIELCHNQEQYRVPLLKWMKSICSKQKYEKSEKKSRLFRTRGNEEFQAFDNITSLSLYSESVRHAPESSTELSLALGNRSAVLFHLKYYNECLSDIEMAFLKGYPRYLQHKLYFRKINCFESLNKYDVALDAVNSARESLKYAERIDESKKASLNEKLDAFLASALEKMKVNEQPSENVVNKERKSEFSQKLDVKYNKLQGRHVVTNSDLKIGQILISETPYALVLLPDHYSRYCHHCCANLLAPLPCCKCTLALYCNDQCRQKSWDEYHRWECGGLDVFHSIGIAHLGLRVALKASPLESLRKKHESLAQSGDVPCDAADGGGYGDVYRLMPHLEDMTVEDIFQYGCTATMLSLYLANYSDYFERGLDSTAREKDIIFVAEVILRHIAQLVCNGHAITKLSTPDICGKAVTETQVRVATAIYPLASMLNHSCDPNIVNSFEGQRLCVKASRDISKGEEVFNCYGPHFRHMAQKERQEALKLQYFFDCTCNQCLQPEGNDFQERFHGLLCSFCKGPLAKTSKGKMPHLMRCLDCSKRQNVKSMEEDAAKAAVLFNEGLIKMEAENEKVALRLFFSCLEIQDKCLYRSHRQRSTCLDVIARCYANMGDYEQSAEFLFLALPAVEEQFGQQSIEVANELQKLSDVLIINLRKQQPGSESFISKYKELEKCLECAYNILGLYYGSWDEGLQEIVGKKMELEAMMADK